MDNTLDYLEDITHEFGKLIHQFSDLPIQHSLYMRLNDRKWLLETIAMQKRHCKPWELLYQHQLSKADVENS